MAALSVCSLTFQVQTKSEEVMGFDLKCQGNIPEKGMDRETESWVKLKMSQVPLWWFICAIKLPLLSLKLFVNVNKLFVKTDMCPAHAMNQYGRYNVTYLAVFPAIARQTLLSSRPQQS